MIDSAEPPVGRALRCIGRFCFEHPWPVLVAALLGAAAAVWLTAARLTLHTDRSELIGRSDEHNRRFLEYEREFGRKGEIVVVVESERAEKNRHFVEALVGELKTRPELFRGVLYKFDLAFFGHNALQFLPEAELKELEEALREFRPSLSKFIGANSFEEFFAAINREFFTAGRSEQEGKRLLKSLPALRRIVSQMNHSLTVPDPSLAPEISMLIGEPEEVLREIYLSLSGGKMFLVNVKWNPQERELTPGAEAIRSLNRILDRLRQDYPGLNIGMTGDPVLEYDEMMSAMRSMQRASWISLLLVAGMFMYAYRALAHPLKVLAALLISVAWTFGFTTLTVGHLNILTITFVPILIGLGVDHGIHLISRFEEEQARGHARPLALELAMSRTGLGVLTGALTMAGAFFAIIFTNFRGIAEMGWITGAGVLLSCAAMLTVLPALLAFEHGPIEKRHLFKRAAPVGHTRGLVEKELLKYPAVTIAIASLVSLLSLVFALGHRGSYFDYNLLKLQSPKLESVVFEKKLIASAEHSVLYAVTDCATLGEARELAEAFAAKQEVVSAARTLADLFQGDPQRKRVLVRQVKATLADLAVPDTEPGPVHLDALSQRLSSLNALLALAQRDLTEAGEEEARREVTKLVMEIDALQFNLRHWERSLLQEKLSVFQQAFFSHLRKTLNLIRLQNSDREVGMGDLPPMLREEFVGRTGRVLVQIYPRENIWERKPLERFVKALREVRSDVTGVPVTSYEYTEVLRVAYNRAAFYAMLAIVALALMHFRNWRLVALALVPLATGVLWMLGAMGFWKISFNPANIMTLPLVLGIGVVNGIQLLHRVREEKTAALLSKSTGKAVLLTSLTTLAGFGSLMVATHPGIVSLGQVMSIGLLTCLVSSVVLVPALLAFFEKKGWKI